MDIEILSNTIATLHIRVIELEGEDASSPHPVYYNPGTRETVVTFDTHQTSREQENKDILELVPLLQNLEQQQ